MKSASQREGWAGAGDGAQGPRSTDTDRYRKQQKQSFNHHAELVGEFEGLAPTCADPFGVPASIATRLRQLSKVVQ